MKIFTLEQVKAALSKNIMLNIKTGVMLMMGAVCMVLNAEKAQAQFSLHSNGVTILGLMPQ